MSRLPTTAMAHGARGFAMMLVLFILVALAALALTMRELAVTQHLETAQSLSVRQAQLAARSAIDWSRAAISADEWSCTPAGACQGPPASLTIDGVGVGLACRCASFFELDQERRSYEVTALAIAADGSVSEARRSLRATILD